MSRRLEGWNDRQLNEDLSSFRNFSPENDSIRERGREGEYFLEEDEDSDRFAAEEVFNGAEPSRVPGAFGGKEEYSQQELRGSREDNMGMFGGRGRKSLYAVIFNRRRASMMKEGGTVSRFFLW